MGWATPEKAAEYYKTYYAANREKKKAAAAAWRAANPEKVRALNAAANAKRTPEYREAVREYIREWNKAKPASYHRNNKLKSKYGITHADYEARLKSQGGACHICKATDPGRTRKHFVVDHDHVSGKLRGLLCNDCNAGLGQFHDNLTFLREAIAYLEKSWE